MDRDMEPSGKWTKGKRVVQIVGQCKPIAIQFNCWSLMSLRVVTQPREDTPGSRGAIDMLKTNTSLTPKSSGISRKNLNAWLNERPSQSKNGNHLFSPSLRVRVLPRRNLRLCLLQTIILALYSLAIRDMKATVRNPWTGLTKTMNRRSIECLQIQWFQTTT